MIDWLSFVCLVLAVRQLTDLYFTIEVFDTPVRDPLTGFKPFNCDYCMNLWCALAITIGWAFTHHLPPIVFLTLWWSVAYTSWLLDTWLPLNVRWTRPRIILKDTDDDTDSVTDVAGDGDAGRTDSASNENLFRANAVTAPGTAGGCSVDPGAVQIATGLPADHVDAAGPGAGGARVYGIGAGTAGATGSGC